MKVMKVKMKVKKIAVAAVIITALISVAAATAVPALIGSALDGITNGADRLAHDAIFIAVLVIIAATASYLTQNLAYSIAYGVGFELRNDIERKIHHLPLSYINRKAKGDLINAVSADTEILSDGLIQGIVQFLTGILTVIFTIVIMLSINVTLGLVVIVITPLSLLTAKLITGRSKREFAASSALRAELSAHSAEWIGNQKLVSAFNMEEESIHRFGSLNEKLRKVGFKAQLFSALVNPTTRFVNGLVYTFTGFIGFMIILGDIPGSVTVGVLAAFLTYANQYTKPFNDISATYAELQNAAASAKRIFSLLNEPEEDNTESNNLTELDKKLTFKDLNFSYLAGHPILKDINFTVPAGYKIAVVGPTGCGKTTLINLLMRFYKLDSGSINIGDVDIGSVKKSSLRANISMVLQDSFIFEGTVLDNIRYGNIEADEDSVINAAKAVGAHSFIKRMKDGYETIISDADNLSAGQKQLISIARVMLTKKPILILDEATSNIDTVTEKKIGKAVKALTEGKTSIIIAHRLSTIVDADMIIVINDGSIVQTGTHNELISTDGIYRTMYEA